MFEIRHRNAPGNIQDLFQDISNIHSYNTRYCLKKTFTHKVLDSQFKGISFFRIGRKIWNKMPISVRKLTKLPFKRNIKQTLFEILAASEDCYIDLPVIVLKVKLNIFLLVCIHF